MAATQMERMLRARISLEGLSVGDAFGERFFGKQRVVIKREVRERKIPDGPWKYTDDTNMALSIYSILRDHGEINQDALAKSFVDHFDNRRGYGAGARRLMVQIRKGTPWREGALNMFEGQGSFGNGAAMRISPLGAYFADDMDALVENARRSSEVTHMHPEGIAGGIAIAAATAIAWQCRGSKAPSRAEFIDRVLPYIPESELREHCRQARDLASTSVEHAVATLGNGVKISAQDTVPFVLWCAGENLHDYEEAMWETVSGMGDRDTTCAMVGGIVVMFAGGQSIPAEWIKRREPLPESVIGN